MELFKIGFVSVRLVDVIDIAIVSFLLYKLFEVVKGSIALRTLGLLFLVFILGQVVGLLDFVLLKSIINELMGLGSIALVILFAPEIRRFLTNITKNTLLNRVIRQARLSTDPNKVYTEIMLALKEIVAGGNGALIILLGNDKIPDIAGTGDEMNAELSSRLIYSVFQKASPLHDGAMLAEGDRILAVRAVLPLSSNPNLPPALGLRHRAALGISEISDSLTIIASEETGTVSLAKQGRLQRNVTYEVLEMAIQDHFGLIEKGEAELVAEKLK